MYTLVPIRIASLSQFQWVPKKKCLFYGPLVFANNSQILLELEMCQYDTDAPAQGPSSPARRHFAKNEVEKIHDLDL